MPSDTTSTRLQMGDFAEQLAKVLYPNNWENEVINLRIAIASLPQPPAQSTGEATPIDMILHCPSCGFQHIDEPDERSPDWTNPPHKSHLCHNCDCIWRPADVPTNGVKHIKTRGTHDTFTFFGPGRQEPFRASTPAQSGLVDK